MTQFCFINANDKSQSRKCMLIVVIDPKAPKKMLCCPLPTDRKMRKNRVGFFFFFFLCQIWAKNLLKFVFNGLKKHLHDLYMRFDCIPPEFSPFRNFKKNIGKLNSLTVRKKKKKKKKKSRPTDPIFKFWSGEGNITKKKFGLITKSCRLLSSST